MGFTAFAESMGFFHRGSGGKGIAPGDVTSVSALFRQRRRSRPFRPQRRRIPATTAAVLRPVSDAISSIAADPGA